MMRPPTTADQVNAERIYHAIMDSHQHGRALGHKAGYLRGTRWGMFVGVCWGLLAGIGGTWAVLRGGWPAW